MLEINGSSGPYNPSTREGYSKNAAYNVMQHDKEVKQKLANSVDEIEFENIQYSSLKGAAADEYVKDAKIYNKENMKALTSNEKVKKEEFIPENAHVGMKAMLEKFFKVVDLNQDGYIDLDESTALTLAQDSVTISDDLNTVKIGTPDGYIENNNKKNIDKYIMEFPEKARDLFKNIEINFNKNNK